LNGHPLQPVHGSRPTTQVVRHLPGPYRLYPPLPPLPLPPTGHSLLPALPTPYKKREKRAVKLCGVEIVTNQQHTYRSAPRHRNCETVEHSRFAGSCRDFVFVFG
jgi:hypothetical protein